MGRVIAIACCTLLTTVLFVTAVSPKIIRAEEVEPRSESVPEPSALGFLKRGGIWCVTYEHARQVLENPATFSDLEADGFCDKLERDVIVYVPVHLATSDDPVKYMYRAFVGDVVPLKFFYLPAELSSDAVMTIAHEE